MPAPLTPLLAFGTVELIIIVIFLAISGVRWILREIQKANEMRELRQKRLEAERQGQFDSPETSADTSQSSSQASWDRTSSGQSLEEIAARRRREIAAMNRPGAPDPNQPNNLTLQQMRERAAAKAEYQRRVELLRQKQAGLSAKSAPDPTPSKPGRPVPLDIEEEGFDQLRRSRQLQEREEQARVKAQAQSQAQLQRQRQQAAQQQQRARQQQMQALRQTASARLTSPPRVRPSQEESHEGPRRSSVSGARELSERTVTAVAAATPRAQVNLSQGSVLLHPQALRDAVILREILDPPVSLRHAP